MGVWQRLCHRRSRGQHHHQRGIRQIDGGCPCCWLRQQLLHVAERERHHQNHGWHALPNCHRSPSRLLQPRRPRGHHGRIGVHQRILPGHRGHRLGERRGAGRRLRPRRPRRPQQGFHGDHRSFRRHGRRRRGGRQPHRELEPEGRRRGLPLRRAHPAHRRQAVPVAAQIGQRADGVGGSVLPRQGRPGAPLRHPVPQPRPSGPAEALRGLRAAPGVPGQPGEAL